MLPQRHSNSQINAELKQSLLSNEDQSELIEVKVISSENKDTKIDSYNKRSLYQIRDEKELDILIQEVNRSLDYLKTLLTSASVNPDSTPNRKYLTKKRLAISALCFAILTGGTTALFLIDETILAVILLVVSYAIVPYLCARIWPKLNKDIAINISTISFHFLPEEKDHIIELSQKFGLELKGETFSSFFTKLKELKSYLISLKPSTQCKVAFMMALHPRLGANSAIKAAYDSLKSPNPLDPSNNIELRPLDPFRHIFQMCDYSPSTAIDSDADPKFVDKDENQGSLKLSR